MDTTKAVYESLYMLAHAYDRLQRHKPGSGIFANVQAAHEPPPGHFTTVLRKTWPAWQDPWVLFNVFLAVAAQDDARIWAMFASWLRKFQSSNLTAVAPHADDWLGEFWALGASPVWFNVMSHSGQVTANGAQQPAWLTHTAYAYWLYSQDKSIRTVTGSMALGQGVFHELEVAGVRSRQLYYTASAYMDTLTQHVRDSMQQLLLTEAGREFVTETGKRLPFSKLAETIWYIFHKDQAHRLSMTCERYVCRLTPAFASLCLPTNTLVPRLFDCWATLFGVSFEAAFIKDDPGYWCRLWLAYMHVVLLAVDLLRTHNNMIGFSNAECEAGFFKILDKTAPQPAAAAAASSTAKAAVAGAAQFEQQLLGSTAAIQSSVSVLADRAGETTIAFNDLHDISDRDLYSLAALVATLLLRHRMVQEGVPSVDKQDKKPEEVRLAYATQPFREQLLDSGLLPTTYGDFLQQRSELVSSHASLPAIVEGLQCTSAADWVQQAMALLVTCILVAGLTAAVVATIACSNGVFLVAISGLVQALCAWALLLQLDSLPCQTDADALLGPVRPFMRFVRWAGLTFWWLLVLLLVRPLWLFGLCLLTPFTPNWRWYPAVLGEAGSGDTCQRDVEEASPNTAGHAKQVRPWDAVLMGQCFLKVGNLVRKLHHPGLQQVSLSTAAAAELAAAVAVAATVDQACRAANEAAVVVQLAVDTQAQAESVLQAAVEIEAAAVKLSARGCSRGTPIASTTTTTAAPNAAAPNAAADNAAAEDAADAAAKTAAAAAAKAAADAAAKAAADAAAKAGADAAAKAAAATAAASAKAAVIADDAANTAAAAVIAANRQTMEHAAAQSADRLLKLRKEAIMLLWELSSNMITLASCFDKRFRHFYNNRISAWDVTIKLLTPFFMFAFLTAVIIATGKEPFYAGPGMCLGRCLNRTDCQADQIFGMTWFDRGECPGAGIATPADSYGHCPWMSQVLQLRVLRPVAAVASDNSTLCTGVVQAVDANTQLPPSIGTAVPAVWYSMTDGRNDNTSTQLSDKIVGLTNISGFANFSTPASKPFNRSEGRGCNLTVLAADITNYSVHASSSLHNFTTWPQGCPECVGNWVLAVPCDAKCESHGRVVETYVVRGAACAATCAEHGLNRSTSCDNTTLCNCTGTWYESKGCDALCESWGSRTFTYFISKPAMSRVVDGQLVPGADCEAKHMQTRDERCFNHAKCTVGKLHADVYTAGTGDSGPAAALHGDLVLTQHPRP